MKDTEKFQKWGLIKQQLHLENTDIFIKPRQIWFVRMWYNVWYEQDGKWDEFTRPVLVIKKLWNMFFIIPLTTWWKNNHIFYHSINITWWVNSKLILNQWKTISKLRFIRHIFTLSKQEFTYIKNLLHKLYIEDFL